MSVKLAQESDMEEINLMYSNQNINLIFTVVCCIQKDQMHLTNYPLWYHVGTEGSPSWSLVDPNYPINTHSALSFCVVVSPNIKVGLCSDPTPSLGRLTFPSAIE